MSTTETVKKVIREMGSDEFVITFPVGEEDVSADGR